MKILAFPKDNNPYQELLYRQLRNKGVSVTYLQFSLPIVTLNIALSMPILLIRRMQGYNVFHIHWVYAFKQKEKIYHSNFIQYLLLAQYKLFLWQIKALGYKLIWTAHNVLPHELVFRNDVAARQFLVSKTDLVIGHTMSTLSSLEKLEIYPQKYVTIPHGSYVGVYQDTISRDESRFKLGINRDTFVYAFVGQIRAYKGIDGLLRAYSMIKNDKTTLIIAGKCREKRLKELLEQNKKDIRWIDEHIADDDLQIYFAAADVIVLPFKSVTTSASALMALSFAKSVIVPLLGNLVYLPDNLKISYNNSDPNGLKNAMLYAYNNEMEIKSKNIFAYKYAKKLSWDKIADKTYKVFNKVCNG